jgi:hypothetical protein
MTSLTSEVDDVSLTVIRITPDRFAKLPSLAREMLRLYPSRSWTEADGSLAFRIATHRVSKLIEACGLCTLQPSDPLESAELAVSTMQRRVCKDS